MRQNQLKIKDSRLKVSVKELVEQVVRQGSLKSGFAGSKRGLEGTLGHQALQRSRCDGYRKEVWVSYQLTDRATGIKLEVQGRIDGVYREGERFVVEEIKTTHQDLEELTLKEEGAHFCQAKLYGFLFAENFKQDAIRVDLTYYQLKTNRSKTFSQSFSRSDLDEFFTHITDLYLQSVQDLYKWQDIRDRSIETLSFPFPAFREGQDQFMDEVEQAIEGAYTLFAQAPTGLGKTVSVLFPAIRACGKGLCSKIFYLTARTTTREAPEQVLELLRQNGLRLKSVVITAKEKTCLQDEMICSPEYCEYLFNYFGKIKAAIRDIFSHDHFNQETIEAVARQHKVCPFELTLDLSVICDCVICDYNYFYDPRIQLARYDTESSQPFVYLVDEAHNLVERSRQMYSAVISKSDVLALKRIVDRKQYEELHLCLTMIDSIMLEIRKHAFPEGKNEVALQDLPGELIDYLIDFIEPAESLLQLREPLPFRDQLLELYYQVSYFIKINQIRDESDAYSVVMYRNQSNLTVKLHCLDAADMIRAKTEKGLATIFFSATLAPIHYFTYLLGGTPDDRAIQLPSPFPPEHRCLCLVDNLSTRYRDRPYTYDTIADYLAIYLSQKQGNYLIFFPSYQYLEEVYERCRHLVQDSGVTLYRQETGMTERERETFIAEFHVGREDTLAGFVVMGGIFGESIDLPGDRLSGAAIIGVGLPQINLERNLIRDYHEQKSGNGFHFAYTYPGLNKVLQASGRLIRTESDRGSLLLIDDRFGNALYKRLFPPEWDQLQIIRDGSTLQRVLDRFWN